MTEPTREVYAELQDAFSHFNLTLVSDSFAGMGRVQRQRAVNAVLAAELAGPVHALSIRALTTVEDQP